MSTRSSSSSARPEVSQEEKERKRKEKIEKERVRKAKAKMLSEELKAAGLGDEDELVCLDVKKRSESEDGTSAPPKEAPAKEEVQQKKRKKDDDDGVEHVKPTHPPLPFALRPLGKPAVQTISPPEDVEVDYEEITGDSMEESPEDTTVVMEVEPAQGQDHEIAEEEGEFTFRDRVLEILKAQWIKDRNNLLKERQERLDQPSTDKEACKKEFNARLIEVDTEYKVSLTTLCQAGTVVEYEGREIKIIDHPPPHQHDDPLGLFGTPTKKAVIPLTKVTPQPKMIYPSPAFNRKPVPTTTTTATTSTTTIIGGVTVPTSLIAKKSKPPTINSISTTELDRIPNVGSSPTSDASGFGRQHAVDMFVPPPPPSEMGGSRAALVVKSMPQLSMKNFVEEVRGYRDKLMAWAIGSQHKIYRPYIPANPATRTVLDLAWRLHRISEYATIDDWCDENIPLDAVLLAFEASVKTEVEENQSYCHAVTEWLRTTRIRLAWDEHTVPLAQYGELMELYKRAIVEATYIPSMEKAWVKAMFKALQWTRPGTKKPDKSNKRIILLTQGILEVPEDGPKDTLPAAFERVLFRFKESRASHFKTSELTEATDSELEDDSEWHHNRRQGSPMGVGNSFKRQKSYHQKEGQGSRFQGGQRSGGSQKPHTQNATSGRCRMCGRTHKAECIYRNHPLRNASGSEWLGSTAANYFLTNYQKEFFVQLDQYIADVRFPPSTRKVVWVDPRKHTQGKSVSLVGALEEPQRWAKERCMVVMKLTVPQVNAQNPTRVVEVLLDTGNEGPNLINCDLVRNTIGISESCCISSVINDSLRLSLSHTITLAHTEGKYFMETKAFSMKDLPYDIVLNYETILKYDLLSVHHNDLLTKGFTGKTFLVNSFAVKQMVASIRKSNRSRKDPFSLEELAEIDDDELQAIPSEFIENLGKNVSSTSLWDKLLTTQVFGPDTLQVQLRKVLEKYKECFLATVSSTPANVPTFTFDVDEEEWHNRKNAGPVRHQTLQRQEVMKDMIDTMLKHGVIRPSSAGYYSHGFVVPKKTPGKWRLVVDYRILNALTREMEHWPIPHIKQLIARIGNQRPAYFAVLDLTSGYHQIEMSEKARKLSAFMTPTGVYEWCRMPMGPKGAPSFFQRTIASEVLHNLIGIGCELYIDDVIVYGQDEESFVNNLQQVFDRFKQFNVTVHPDKCVFGKSEVEYVGHIISREGVHFNREKLDQVKDLELPETVKQLQSFIGICNWYSSHVAGFAMIAAPLTSLLHGKMAKGQTKLQWSEEALSAFETLKEKVVNCQPLFFLDEESPIVLQTDASLYGIGAALLQQRGNEVVPIALLSKKFNKVQLRWSTPEKEAYAIYHTLRTWEYLLKDRHFTLHTDHLNLEKLSHQCGLNLKVLRWFQAIQDYDMEVKHIPGIENVIADALSRAVARTELEPDLVLTVNIADEKVSSNNWKAIKTCHNSIVGHGGVERTLLKLQGNGLEWRNQRQDVKKYIQSCPDCQKMQQFKPVIVASRKMLSAFQPMQQLAMDFIEGLPETEEGMDTILVIIDTFTRFVEMYPCKGTGANAMCAAVLQHLGRYGIPDEILSDNGPAFCAELLEALCKVLGPDHITITPYSHEENGIVERANKEVTRFLSDLVRDEKIVTNWPLLIPLVQRIMNAAVHTSLGVAPATMVFGNRIDLDRNLILRPPTLNKDSTLSSPLSGSAQGHMDLLISAQDRIVDMVKRQLVNREKSLQTENDRHLHEVTKFNLDSLVLVQPREGRRAHKLAPRWLGPKRVINISENGTTYTLQDLVTMRNHDYHVTQLKDYIVDLGHDRTPLQVALADHDRVFIVERILDIRGDPKGLKGQLEFLVKWQGYDDETWEPWAALRNVEELHTFLRRHPDVQVRKLLPQQFRLFVNTIGRRNRKRRIHN